jgi:hypothetical protein
MTCRAWVRHYRQRKVRQFRAGRLDDAAGYRLPRTWRRAMNRWAAHHPRRAAHVEARLGDWWRWPLEAWACTPIAGAGYRANCDNAAEHHRQYTRKVRTVVVVCSGAAAIGALAGGGAAGAGRGALACLWGNLALAWVNPSGFRPALKAPELYGPPSTRDADPPGAGPGAPRREVAAHAPRWIAPNRSSGGLAAPSSITVRDRNHRATFIDRM